MTTGNLPIYRQLEVELARFFGVPDAILTSSGYMAPLVAAQALARDHTHVLIDERAHACLADAAALTGLPIRAFPHRDPEALQFLVQRLGPQNRALIFTDGLFSHSGQVAPIDQYLEILPGSATLLVDDAHAVGILGEHGRGSLEALDLPLRRCVVTATLSKAFGSYGGMVLGSRALRRAILARSRITTGNTALPPPSAAGAMAAIEVLRTEGHQRRRRLFENSRKVKAAATAPGAEPLNGIGPMFSLAPAGRRAVDRMRRLLMEAEVYPAHISYPNGPAPRYFRFAISSEHSAGQLAALSNALSAYHRVHDT
jgi:7-keto-8-aminopelargonate synthetase-like enzyme